MWGGPYIESLITESVKTSRKSRAKGLYALFASIELEMGGGRGSLLNYIYYLDGSARSRDSV